MHTTQQVERIAPPTGDRNEFIVDGRCAAEMKVDHQYNVPAFDDHPEQQVQVITAECPRDESGPFFESHYSRPA